MKPFVVLLLSFLIILTGTALLGPAVDLALAGTVSMTIMLLFTAVGHFAFTRGMTMMLPGFIPLKKQLVWATGILEIAAAIGIHISGYRMITGWLLILFFLVLLPANIYAAKRKVNYQKGSYTGKGLSYLWIRLPLQLIYIGWVYFFIVHTN